MFDMNTVVQLIGSVGFPIVCCIYMMWYVKDSSEKHREEITSINEKYHDEIVNLAEKHKEEVTALTEALNNNTLALQHLCDTLYKEGQ